MSKMIELALQRPANYRKLLYAEQLEIDEELGLANWRPTPEEQAEYRRRHAQQLKDHFRRKNGRKVANARRRKK